MRPDARDALFMERALFLAERGRGRTTPNPIVGAVVVAPGGVVVGQGAHLQAGGPHAEIHALEAAGSRAAGATLYCTLEPCSHVGRTGACVERIAAAGIARVVAAIQDPNPRVAGGGFAYLRAHGIDVIEGVAADDARRQIAPFGIWITKHRPFVTLKCAISADGFVGGVDSRVRLTGPAADRWLHRQRAEVDAIAVGSGTVLVDDPLLTARGAYRYRPLTRVVFDARMRIRPSARVCSTLAAGPVIILVDPRAAEANPPRVTEFSRLGVTVVPCDVRNLPAALASLAARELVSILVEGGPALHGAFADAGLVDRVQRVETPHRLGSGIRAAVVFESVARAGNARMIPLGDDVLMEADVHRPD